MSSFLRRACLALSLVAATSAAQESAPTTRSIAWERSYDAAFARAKAESRPVLVAFNRDDEPANDDTAVRIYRDPRIVLLSREFVCIPASLGHHVGVGDCPRFPGGSCREHQECEGRARSDLLESNTVEVPQHVFLAPDGTELFRKVWFVDVDVLAALMEQALVRTRPERAAKTASRPTGVGAAGDPSAGGAGTPPVPPPTDLQELFRALTALRTSKPGSRQPAADQVGMMRGPDVESALTALLEVPDADLRFAVLRAIGKAGRIERLPLVLPRLEADQPLVRRAAIVACEELAASEAADALVRRLAVEVDGPALGELLRATAVLCPKRPEPRAAAIRALRHREEGVVRQAVIALGVLPPNDAAEAALAGQLENARSERTRAGAAWSLAEHGLKKYRLKITTQRKKVSTDARAGAVMDMAAETLAGVVPDGKVWRDYRDYLAGLSLPRRS